MVTTERPREPGERLKRMGGTRFIVLITALLVLMIGFAVSQLIPAPTVTPTSEDDTGGNDSWPG